jgi:hypothetical protein
MTSTATAVAAFLAAKNVTRVATGARAMTEGQVYAATRDAKSKVTILGDAFPDDHAAAIELRAMLPRLAVIGRTCGNRENYVSMFDTEYNAAMYNFRNNTPFTPLRRLIAETIKCLVADYFRNAKSVSDVQAETLSAFNRKMGFEPIW